MNPMAWRRKPLVEEEILASAMLSYPLTQYMFCSPGEGGVALVLCRADRARAVHRPPRVPRGRSCALAPLRELRGAGAVVGRRGCDGANGRRVDRRVRDGGHRSRGCRRGAAAGHRGGCRSDAHGGERLLRRRRPGGVDRRGRDRDRRPSAGEHRRRLPCQRRARSARPACARCTRTCSSCVAMPGSDRCPNARASPTPTCTARPASPASPSSLADGLRPQEPLAFVARTKITYQTISFFRGRSPMALRAEPGLARSPGISYQELLDTDSRAVPEVLRLMSPQHLGSADIPIDRYTSRAWHELEVERLWSRVWQFACREEEIPRPGDFHVYEIASMSFVVMRTRSGAIKAYRNACLHRGRRLKDYDGHCSELRCPFHGFAWALDGALQDVPARWDFPHVDDDEFRLPEARVDTWAGFVFINPDPFAEPLAAFVSDLAEQFAGWDLGAVLQGSPRRQGHQRELEDRARGVLRGVPRERHPSADHAVHRRHQQPSRHLGQLRARDHAGRDTEPAARAGSRRRRRCCGPCSMRASARCFRSRWPRVKPCERSARR